MKIKLASGDTVFLGSFYTTTTYGGLMLGHPTPEINARIVDSTLGRASRLWGGYAPHLIPPVVREDGEWPRLPEMTNYALLHSTTAVRGSGIRASHLTVIWFAPEQSDMPLSAIISEVILDLPWKDLAYSDV